MDTIFLRLFLLSILLPCFKPDDDLFSSEKIDEEDFYRPIHVVKGTKGQCFKAFKNRYSADNIKTTDVHEGSFDETTIIEDEIELEDVEYREELALKNGKDPQKIWKSEKLKGFMKENPGIHMNRHKEDKHHSRRKRLAISNEERYWPKAIVPFVWSADYDVQYVIAAADLSTKNGVVRAMRHIEYWTCVRYVEWTNMTSLQYGLEHNNRLKFNKQGGCSSFVGRTNALDGQSINCCRDRACVHELSHAMGLFHEQKSPLHKDFIRIIFENLDPTATSYSNYREISPTLVKTYGRYDLTSLMHYEAMVRIPVSRRDSCAQSQHYVASSCDANVCNCRDMISIQFGHNDYKDPIAVLDSEDDLLLLNGDPTDFYMFNDLSDISKCSAETCADFQLTCQNWGYVTYIRDRCQCRCINGLDPYSGCNNLYRTDLTAVLEWPADGFTLLKPDTGCPQGFLEGKIEFTTLLTSESTVNNAFMSHDGTTWNISFCTKKPVIGVKEVNVWGPGKYCMFQHGGTCPQGFSTGSILIDSESPPILNGVQPDGIFKTDVKWKFCCRSDGSRNVPLVLPNKEPFILFEQTYYGCQSVEGMTYTEQYFRVKNVNGSVAYRMGSYPRVNKSFKNFYIFFCYYSPVNFDRTEFYSRWPAEPFSMIKPKNGCPSGFLPGMKRQFTEPVLTSDVLNSDVYVGSSNVTYYLCSKEPSMNLGPRSEWPKGSYCILSFFGKCPLGFDTGYVKYDDMATVETSGFVPDDSNSGSLEFHFCCREDGTWSDPISLPNEEPFILFRHNDFPCQKVVDMVGNEEFAQVRNALTKQQNISGSVPRIQVLGRTYQIHFCHYFKPEFDCGGIFELRDSNPIVEISSPNYPGAYSPRKRCNFIFKAPENSKLILNFKSFNVEATESGECVSSVGIRSDLPGQPDIKYCGDKFENTIITYQNFLGISFTSTVQNYNNLTGFSAAVKLYKEQDLCYTNNGTTYAGKVNVTRKFQKCLPWSKVTHCTQSLYGRSDSASFLEKNYCRKAGGGLEPWCFVESEQCLRDNCDVCNIGSCYDIFLDCIELIAENPNFCVEDEEAPRGCRKTCGRCDNNKPVPVPQVKCSTPRPLVDSAPTTFLKTSYSVGETVPYKCLTSPEIEVYTCLADGTWSGGNFVCGRCPSGWIRFRDACYKWFDVYMTAIEGNALCSNNSAAMASAKDQAEDDFLLNIRDNSRSFWLGMDKNNGQSYWTYDNSPVTWSNWAPGTDPSLYKCANIQEDGKWNSWGCDWDYFSIICKFKPSERLECLDYRSDCVQLLRDDPGFCVAFQDFATNNCPWTCGVCGTVTTCDRPPYPPNTVQTTGSSGVPAGKFFGYKCTDGYELSDGDVKRACLRDGTLTGKPPVCLKSNLVPSRNNDLSLRKRKFLEMETKMFIGNNTAMRIHKSGKVVSWMFYSLVNCEVTFSVWRLESLDRYTLVGKNTIIKSRHDRKRKVDIPAQEQISVLKNDLIGVYFADGKGSCIPYDLCKLNQDLYGQQMEAISRKGLASSWIVNTGYNFKRLVDDSRCKTWSFSAVVQ